MSDAYPVLDTRNGSFLTNINLFYGFAVAKAVAMEIEPTILFTNNDRIVDYHLGTPFMNQGDSLNYAHTTSNNLLAFPIVVNVKFFPFFSLTNFSRLFFIGGGIGAVWIREENDAFFNNNPTGFEYNVGELFATASTDQWQILFRAITGFTGTGGQFGFGGELRYNFIPLTEDLRLPFATRFAKNANSLDITLRFYFSL
jgi:hypothetical protein